MSLKVGAQTMIIMKLQSIEDTPQALMALQERKMVIVNLARLDSEEAQRVVDWVAGGTYAIDGQTFWLGERTFLFAPSSVQVTTTRQSPSSIAPSLERCFSKRAASG